LPNLDKKIAKVKKPKKPKNKDKKKGIDVSDDSDSVESGHEYIHDDTPSNYNKLN